MTLDADETVRSGIDLTVHTPIDPHHDRQLVFQGYTVLLTNPDGSITEGSGLGLFDKTRGCFRSIAC
jgi:hypothetical protein